MKAVGGLFFCKKTKFFISFQQDLVLVAVTGENVFDQRFRLVKFDGVFISDTGNGRKIGCQFFLPVFKAKLFIQLFGGQHDAAVELLDQLADLFHMAAAIGAAQKSAARL